VPGRTNYRERDVVGRWTLIEFIKSGGNGDVWRVSAEDELRAMKILHRTEPKGYERFKRVVSICERLDIAEFAILPVIDSHLPASPNRANRAWFVMPLAYTFTEALAGASLVEKVEAMRDIAHTLARLLEREHLNHRDVKPENLYIVDERAVVGDFGLAKRPDDPALTDEGKIPGPFFHLPSEVFLEEQPDWERVDVYCLANSLWRIVAEKPYPPRGQIRADEEDSLARLFPAETYIGGLAAVIAGATARSPLDRPSLQSFAEQLDAWLERREVKDDFVAIYVDEGVRNQAVLRWVVAFVRREPVFDMWLYDVEDPDAPSNVEGLSRAQVRDALSDLIETYAIVGQPGLALGSREPVYFERVYPTLIGLNQVADIEVAMAETEPLLRNFVTSADYVQLPMSIERVELPGGLTLTPPEAFFQMWLMEQHGFLAFERLHEMGGISFLDVRTTRAGKQWLFERQR
jgi:hypothetical protein